ncbi:Transcriptional repressor CTCF [Halotydeus destructor]|nr:Transcriptional repressor CTCF [Halotydeus destructor]
MTTNAGPELVTADDGAETITDIQNYLQSFNKEIGEAGAGDGTPGSATFYTIDTSQVLGGDSGAGSNGTPTTVAGNVSGGDAGGGYQTVAIVPDGASGGYVLIVQPSAGQNQTQVQLPVGSTSNSMLTNSSQVLTADLVQEKDHIDDIRTPTNNRVKKEKELEKPNDISVYDFEEVNPPGTTFNETGELGEEDEDDEELEDEELDESGIDGDSKPRKRLRRTVGSVKKQKVAVATTPSGSNHHMCNYCNYTSNKRYLLSRHMKSHSEERPHKCGICERGFKTIASLQNHVNTHTGVRPHQCKYCEAAFTTSGELVRHVRYRHTHEKPHRCNECDYASVELSKLKRHMRCHTGERPYQCPHCTYASPDTYKLKRHLRIHTGEKPYECDVCHARFTQSNSLKAHRLIHSGNKPIFKCELCPTTCGRKTDLRIHVQKLHTSEKPLTCKRCDQSFPDRYSFKLHLKTHEGEKCFKCDLCNYASVSARHLESHMLIHTDQKPYQCDECEQSFRQKQLLKRHKNLYHNPEYIPPQPKEKTHECAHCCKAFRHKGNLMRHLAIHDPDAYKESLSQVRGNDNHQLIDEDEDEEEEEETDDEGTSMILSNATGDDTLDPQTLQFTLDPQTQQMLQGGEQVVVFEVVQMNNGDGTNGGDGEQTALIAEAGNFETPKKGGIITKRTLRHAGIVGQANGTPGTDNIIIQLQAEDAEAANAIQDDSIIDEAEFTSGKSIKITLPGGGVPPPVVAEDTKSIRDQLQKQKDMADCFGFKDDDEEDDAILSMPAAHAQ